MKVLVVGNGGREHALAWKLLQSANVSRVICVPGNGGTSTIAGCQNVPLEIDDFEGIAHLAEDENITFVVVGPEAPLAGGITNYLTDKNIKVFGPSQAGAKIEASKSWAKELMVKAGVPTGEAGTFTDAETALAYIHRKGAPIVVKADGLAAGKGVTVAGTVAEAEAAVKECFQGKSTTIVIEEFLTGQEVSVLALTDGKDFVTLLPAQDHKQVGEGDTGANTGGMGAYAPTPVVDDKLMERIATEVIRPTLEILQQKGIDYRGVLYAGLMITPAGEPKVLEFNARFGDPETQAILSLLETPLEELMLACIEQRLGELPPLCWKQGSAVCVVAASQGYPGGYEKGFPIEGISQAEDLGAVVFHAGTKLENQQVVTNGGRVLGITTVGENFEEAIAKTYQAVNAINFTGMFYRKDIGHRVR